MFKIEFDTKGQPLEKYTKSAKVLIYKKTNTETWIAQALEFADLYTANSTIRGALDDLGKMINHKAKENSLTLKNADEIFWTAAESAQNLVDLPKLFFEDIVEEKMKFGDKKDYLSVLKELELQNTPKATSKEELIKSKTRNVDNETTKLLEVLIEHKKESTKTHQLAAFNFECYIDGLSTTLIKDVVFPQFYTNDGLEMNNIHNIHLKIENSFGSPEPVIFRIKDTPKAKESILEVQKKYRSKEKNEIVVTQKNKENVNASGVQFHGVVLTKVTMSPLFVESHEGSTIELQFKFDYATFPTVDAVKVEQEFEEAFAIVPKKKYPKDIRFA